MQKTILFISVSFFFASQSALAEEKSSGYYVLGGLSYHAIGLNGPILGNTRFKGTGIRLGGGYMHTQNIRTGGFYQQATLHADVSTFIKDDFEDVNFSAIGACADYIFDVGFYFGGCFTTLTFADDGSGKKATTTSEPGIHIGGFWTLDNNIFLDIVWESHEVNVKVHGAGPTPGLGPKKYDGALCTLGLVTGYLF